MRMKWPVAVAATGLVLPLACGLLRFKANHDYAYVPSCSVTVPRPYPRAGQAIDGLAFSPDSRTLAAADTQTGIGLWTVPQLQCQSRTGTSISDAVVSVFWTPNGAIIAGDNSEIRRWKVSKGNLLPLPSKLPANQMLGSKSNRAYHYQRHIVSPSGRLAAADDASGNVAVWDVQTGGKLFSIAAPPLGQFGYPIDFCDITFSPDEHFLATTFLRGDNSVAVAPLDIALRDARTGAIRKSWQWKTDDMMKVGVDSGGNLGENGLMFSPDGTLLAMADIARVALLDTQTGQIKRVLEAGSGSRWGGTKHLIFFAHGRLLAGAGWGDAVPIWNVATGKLLQTFHGEGPDLQALAVSPDDKWLATGEQDRNADGKIKLWDVSRLLH